MSLPKIYVSRMDVELSYFEEFMTWCKCKHWPDVIGVGFYSANGYLSDQGGPIVCNVYEIPGVEVFSPSYDHMRENDEELKVIVKEKIKNHSLTIYEQRTTEGILNLDSVGSPEISQSWSCPAMSSLRFETLSAHDDEVLKIFKYEIFPKLSMHPAFMRARLLSESGKHPTYPSPEPRWAVVVEWAELDAALASHDLLLGNLQERLGDDLERVAFNACHHVFSLRNSSKWRP